MRIMMDTFDVWAHSMHLGVHEVQAAAVRAQVDVRAVPTVIGGGGALESQLIGVATRGSTPHLACHVMSCQDLGYCHIKQIVMIVSGNCRYI